MPCLEGDVILGVDTHRDTHAAVLVDMLGRLVAAETFRGDPSRAPGADHVGPAPRHDPPRRRGGHRQLRREPRAQLKLEGVEVIEVTRATRVGRRHVGKNDTRDAEAAARSVLSGQATAQPKSRDGIVESIRVLRNARASAVKARVQAILHLKNLVVTAPDELREPLNDLTSRQLVERCARMHRPRQLDSHGATRAALRTLARRYQALNAEIAELDTMLTR